MRAPISVRARQFDPGALWRGEVAARASPKSGCYIVIVEVLPDPRAARSFLLSSRTLER